MKTIFLAVLCLFYTFLLSAQDDEGTWDAYMAAYQDDNPGSTILRMDLIEKAPLKEYSKLLITGVTYKSNREDGFPDKEMLQTLYEINDKLEALLKKHFEIIYVGSFTYNYERLGYYYIKSDKNLEKKLQKFYKKNYPGFKSQITIKEDIEWKAYTEFLYPSEEILGYMYNKKVVKALYDAGDLLTEKRRIDHWLWFHDETKLKECISELEQLGYTIEGYKKVEERENLYSIQIWKNGLPDMENISAETSSLQVLAKKYDGEYDGWETIVVKK